MCVVVFWFTFQYLYKHPTQAILQNICSWGDGLLENRICSYKNWECSPGKFDLFLWYLLLLEIVMCSNEILDKISWKIWSVLMIIFPPWKLYVFLRYFEKALLKNLYVFLHHFWYFWKIWCVLEIFLKKSFLK